MNKKTSTIIKLLLIVVLFISQYFTPTSVFAAKTFNAHSGALNTVVNKTGIEKTDINTMFGDIVGIAMGLTGFIYLILMVYSGFRWMTAQGEEEPIKTARNTIIAATIGMAVLIGAYVITNFISEQLISKVAG